MKWSILIRLAGLVAIVGGVLYAAQGLAVWLWEPPFSLSVPYLNSVSDLAIQNLVNVSDIFPIVGALVVVVALPALHRDSYAILVTLVSLVAFVGLVLLLVTGLGAVLSSFQYWISTSTPLDWGITLTALGGIGLGALTLAARVLPWWCGAALIVGGVGFGPAALLGELFVTLAGVAWALVGFAIFRARSRQAEQPSRVQ
jgi:hypothetical protein